MSMAAYGARRLHRMNKNINTILGVEFRGPLATSPALMRVVVEVRNVIPTIVQDRYFANDIAAAGTMIADGKLVVVAGIDGFVTGAAA